MTEYGEDFPALLDLTEYESDALEELLLIGRATAPNLAEATGIPKARIYGVLDSLSDAGYLKVIPGRPKRYQPHEPSAIVDRAIENQQDAYEQFKSDVQAARESFTDAYTPVQNRGVDELSPTEGLFHVVNVGEPSERETRRLYRTADENVFVMTKSFEYIDEVSSSLRNAVDNGVSVNVIMLSPNHLTADNRRGQREISQLITDQFQSVDVRISERELPWRGTFVDPSLSYDSGQGLFLVEQEELLNHHRQAAVTENPSFVAGLWQYFDPLWLHESHPSN